MAVERVVVQQQHRHALGLGGPQERRQVQRVAAEQVDVVVAVPDVELQREPRLDRGPGQRGDHGPVGDPVRPGVVGPQLVQADQDVEVAGPLAGQVEAAAVRRDALRADRLGLREPLPDGGQQVADRGAGRQQVLGDRLQPRDLVRAGGGAGQRGDLGGRADVVGQEPGVDEQGVDLGGAPASGGRPPRVRSPAAGPGRCRRRRGARGPAAARSDAGSPGRASSRTASPSTGRRPRPRSSAPRTTAGRGRGAPGRGSGGRRPGRDVLSVAHASWSAFSRETESFRASPGEAIITMATRITQPNATITRARPGLASGNGITLRQIV